MANLHYQLSWYNHNYLLKVILHIVYHTTINCEKFFSPTIFYHQIKQYPLVDNYISSHHLTMQKCINIVGRNSLLVINPGNERVSYAACSKWDNIFLFLIPYANLFKLDPSRISDLLMLQVMECLRAKGEIIVPDCNNAPLRKKMHVEVKHNPLTNFLIYNDFMIETRSVNFRCTHSTCSYTYLACNLSDVHTFLRNPKNITNN